MNNNKKNNNPSHKKKHKCCCHPNAFKAYKSPRQLHDHLLDMAQVRVKQHMPTEMELLTQRGGDTRNEPLETESVMNQRDNTEKRPSLAVVSSPFKLELYRSHNNRFWRGFFFALACAVSRATQAPPWAGWLNQAVTMVRWWPSSSGPASEHLLNMGKLTVKWIAFTFISLIICIFFFGWAVQDLLHQTRGVVQRGTISGA